MNIPEYDKPSISGPGVRVKVDRMLISNYLRILTLSPAVYVYLMTVQLVSVTLQIVWEIPQICDLCPEVGKH